MKIKHILLLQISVFGCSCNRIEQYRAENTYNPEDYKNYKITDTQDSALFSVISFMHKNSFQGQFGFREDSLVFGYVASDKIEIPDTVRDILRNYSLEDKVYHRNGVTYFQLSSGFIDDNCGIMYLPIGTEIPVQVRSNRHLRRSDHGKGDWYFVETKL